MLETQAIIFIIIAILCASINRILGRYVLKDTEPYAYSLSLMVVGTFVFLPVALSNFSLPHGTTAYIVLVVSGILWALATFLTTTATKGAEVSLKEPVGKSQLLWVLLFGVLFLGETATVSRILGTFIMFLGILFVVWHPERKLGRFTDHDVRMVLIAALMSAVVNVIDKFALRYFVPEVYLFFGYLIPAMVLLLFVKKRKHHIMHLFKHRGTSTILAMALSFITYYAIIKTYSLVDVTVAYPLIQLSLLFTTLGGILFLKEREHLAQRIIGAAIILIGAIVLGL